MLEEGWEAQAESSFSDAKNLLKHHFESFV